jgi:hypothetical protein
MLLGLVARQRHQPSLGLRRDRRLLAGSRSIIEGRQLSRSRTEPASRVERAQMLLGYRENPSFLAVGQSLEVHHQTVQRCVGHRPFEARNLVIPHRQLDRMPPSCHDVIPRSAKRKRGIREQTARSMISFMESVV